MHLVDAEIIKRLADIEIGLSRRYDAEFRRSSARHDDAVDGISPGEGFHRRYLVFMQPRFLRHPVIARPDVQPVRRQHVILGRHRLRAVKTGLDNSRGLDRIMHTFHADPDAGIARQREPQEPEVDDLLHPGR